MSEALPSDLGELVNLGKNLRDQWFVRLSVHLVNDCTIDPGLGSCIRFANSTETLVLSFNDISGPFRRELSALTNLEILDFEDNQLTGTIPRQIGMLTNLESLNLGENSLAGSLSSEAGLLTNLRFLDLHFNQLTGSIPSEIGQLTNLGMFLSVDPKFQGSTGHSTCLGPISSNALLRLNHAAH